METGLFLSRDDGSISDVLDFDSLSKEYTDLSAIKIYDNFFSVKSQKSILKTIKQKHLDSVVFAGNSPKYFENVISGSNIIDKVKKLGINKNKIGFANIREQVAFSSKSENGEVTQKAKLLIDVALKKVKVRHDAKINRIPTRKSVLVIGANAGGVFASVELINKGYNVVLIDKDSSFQNYQANNDIIQPSLSVLQTNKKALIYFNSALLNLSGHCGNFHLKLNLNDTIEELFVGGIILSPGDDRELIKELKPILALDTDDKDQIHGRNRIGAIGSTMNPGVWFIPTKKESTFDSAMSGASVAVLSLTTLLDRDVIEHAELITEVDESACGGCGTCVKTCAFSASSIHLEDKLSVIDGDKCRGCGNCVVACPTGARDLITYPKDYIFHAIQILSQKINNTNDPKILTFLCNGCGYPAADLAGVLAVNDPNLRYSTNIMPLHVECGGNIGTQYILEAFHYGFDGVALSVCRDGHCHHIVGNTDMERRMSLFRAVLRSRRINDNRVRILKISPHEGKLFSKEIQSFSKDLVENIK